jgi:hypothetical protein
VFGAEDFRENRLRLKKCMQICLNFELDMHVFLDCVKEFGSDLCVINVCNLLSLS